MRNDDQSFSTLENINKLFKRLLKSDKDALPLKHINKLVNDLTEMLSTDFHDTEIIVGEDEDIKTFKVHSTILKARSSYFKTTLSNSNKKSANGIFLFEMKNISPQSFEILLTYIYNGTISIDVDDMDAGSVLKLIEACAELALDDLSEDLQNYFITEREEWIQQNLIYVDNISFEKYRPSLKLLQSYCDELYESYPELYLISNDFLDIEKSLFKSIVEKDALEMDEIEIWSYVIQWGIAQANDEELESKDVSLWDDDDFVKFKNILQDFIPLIRFNQITSSDFFYSVTPYKEIFDPILYEKILQYYLDKRLSTSLCQKGPRGKGYLLNLQMKSLISSWIDDKMTKDLLYNSTNSPYDFELILRGSEDGFSRSVFEEKCYNIEQTLAIMRIHETNKLIGCYNPVCWNNKEKSLNDQYFINTDKSFIFEIDHQMFGSISRFISKVDDKLINNSKLSKVINPQRAIFHDRQKISLKKENVKFHEIILNFLDLQLCISNNKRPYCLSNDDADNSYQRNLNIQSMIKNVHLLAEYEVYKLVKKDFHKL